MWKNHDKICWSNSKNLYLKGIMFLLKKLIRLLSSNDDERLNLIDSMENLHIKQAKKEECKCNNIRSQCRK